MLNIFSGLDLNTAFLLGLALAFVLFYEAINGFHDTANAITTVVYTRAMREELAVLMAAVCNFLGVILGGLSVAYAIVHLLPTDLLLNIGSSQGTLMVFSILLAAIIWNLGTWYLGIPASSSHTLIGSIIGVALANSFISKTSLVEALNLSKVVQIFLSLILSPLVGLILAGLLMFFLRQIYRGSKKRERIHLTPTQREKQDGKRKPPFWTRIMLILSAIGVSFAHGANDGQKGIGLLMLVLISITPASFVVNMQANSYDITRTQDALKHLQEYYKDHIGDLEKIIKAQETKNSVQPQDNYQYHCNNTRIMPNLERVQQLLSNINGFYDLTPEQRNATRRLLICVADTAQKVASLPSTPSGDARYINKLRKDILETVEYAPLWIIISVALALAIGTMIGWRRVAVTIGKKIGKSEMTYAQGVSAQFTAAASIGIASYTGMPVSTTQVLSSAVVGTMIADKKGVQSKTVKSIAWTWLLTLPVSIAMSAGFYFLACWLFL